jgi:hypothetical protein
MNQPQIRSYRRGEYEHERRSMKRDGEKENGTWPNNMAGSHLDVNHNILGLHFLQGSSSAYQMVDIMSRYSTPRSIGSLAMPQIPPHLGSADKLKTFRVPALPSSPVAIRHFIKGLSHQPHPCCGWGCKTRNGCTPPSNVVSRREINHEETTLVRIRMAVMTSKAALATCTRNHQAWRTRESQLQLLLCPAAPTWKPDPAVSLLSMTWL